MNAFRLPSSLEEYARLTRRDQLRAERRARRPKPFDWSREGLHASSRRALAPRREETM